MNYKKIYEKQYGEKKLVSVPKKQFCGLRGLLRKYDQDRYNITQRLVGSGDKVLDIGCGDGYLLRNLAGKFNELYGLDVSPSRLKEAENYVKQTTPTDSPKFKFIEGNADSQLPFPADFFDTIVCMATVEHVYDIFSLCKEIYRVLKPSGFVIAEVPNIAYFKHRLTLFSGRLPVTSSPINWQEIGWDGGHVHYFTMEKFCWLFQSQGFHIIAKSGSGFLAQFRNWWPSFLCGDLIIKAVKV